jgi:hypothetical protein
MEISILTPRNVARLLGGEVTGPDSVNVPGPNHKPGDRSLSIKFDRRAPGGFIVYSHAGDDFALCRDYVRGRLGLPPWSNHPSRAPLVVVQTKPDDHDEARERNKQYALKIWHNSIDPRGTIVERYLNEHRKLALPTDIANGVLRCHWGLKYNDSYLPGMVALLRDIDSNEPVGIHRTFLDRNTARKIDRKMLGTAKNAAIIFDEPTTKLVIGEGVESVMSARAEGLFGPCWAMGSSGAVKVFPVLKSIRTLTILEENDQTSQSDVSVCMKRYRGAGRSVEIVTPTVGSDFNDAWRA